MINTEMPVEEYLARLNETDRETLINVLTKFRIYNLDVIARGSTISRPATKKYNDIDLIVRGDFEDFIKAVREIDGNDERSLELYPHQVYVGVGNLTFRDVFWYRNGSALIDVNYTAPKKIDTCYGDVDLVINLASRQ